ncbi:MAG: galactose-1-phosphate uridylyltransferase, partial [Lachnospiraceae bacterium]|nr:galactose-1-phosphate uridylyltransferase [Lachnospiraceae bacterium]
MRNVQVAVTDLAAYALRTGLIEKEDILYSVNSLLGILQLDAWEGSEMDVEARAQAFTEEELASGLTLEQILGALLDDAAARGLLDGGSVVARDLYDTRLMGALTARPSDVIRSFRAVYAEDPEKATDWYYAFSRNTDYIRRYRIARDRKWKTATEYGELDVTINLSKPEKDLKAIAAARTQKQGGYPKCQLCRENEGYYGRL